MTLKRRFTKRGPSRRGDSLDLLDQEGELLSTAFHQWGQTHRGQSAGRMAGASNFDNGTIGKVIVEHAAIHLGAARDVCRVAQQSEQIRDLRAALDDIWPLIDRLDELSRGTSPVSIAANDDFAATIDSLEGVLRPIVADRGMTGRLARCLGDRRHQLRTASYIRKHAPTHPGPGRWYDKVGPVARAHTAYDRARGFPWSESTPLASPELPQRYDRGA